MYINHRQYIGKSKKSIIEELGQEFNYFHFPVWTFVINKYWWGQKKVLFLYFEEEIVVKTKLICTYGKITNKWNDKI